MRAELSAPRMYPARTHSPSNIEHRMDPVSIFITCALNAAAIFVLLKALAEL